MRIGLCTSVANAAAIQDAPIAYLEEHVQHFLVPEEEEDVFREKLKSARAQALPIEAANCFLPGGLKCVGPAVDTERIRRYAETAFRRAQEVGITIIVFGSGGARGIPEGFSRSQALEQFVRLLGQLGPRAQARGITIVVEPLNRGECNFINSLAEGAEVVKKCALPNVRLVADIYHILREDETPAEVLRFGELIKHTHIAERDRRTAPGVTGDDFRPYLKALRQIGYNQRMSVECRWDDMQAELPNAIHSLDAQLHEAGYEA